MGGKNHVFLKGKTFSTIDESCDRYDVSLCYVMETISLLCILSHFYRDNTEPFLQDQHGVDSNNRHNEIPPRPTSTGFG